MHLGAWKNLIQLQNLPSSVHLSPWYPASQWQVLFAAQTPFSHGGSHISSTSARMSLCIKLLPENGKKQVMRVLLCIFMWQSWIEIPLRNLVEVYHWTFIMGRTVCRHTNHLLSDNEPCLFMNRSPELQCMHGPWKWWCNVYIYKVGSIWDSNIFEVKSIINHV